jgi:hypothetical protein
MDLETSVFSYIVGKNTETREAKLYFFLSLDHAFSKYDERKTNEMHFSK